MEKFLVLSLLFLFGVFIVFLVAMILIHMAHDLVRGSVRACQWAAGRKRST